MMQPAMDIFRSIQIKGIANRKCRGRDRNFVTCAAIKEVIGCGRPCGSRLFNQVSLVSYQIFITFKSHQHNTIFNLHLVKRKGLDDRMLIWRITLLIYWRITAANMTAYVDVPNQNLFTLTVQHVNIQKCYVNLFLLMLTNSRRSCLSV
jgi:hypothetical protein